MRYKWGKKISIRYLRMAVVKKFACLQYGFQQLFSENLMRYWNWSEHNRNSFTRLWWHSGMTMVFVHNNTFPFHFLFVVFVSTIFSSLGWQKLTHLRICTTFYIYIYMCIYLIHKINYKRSQDQAVIVIGDWTVDTLASGIRHCVAQGKWARKIDKKKGMNM